VVVQTQDDRVIAFDAASGNQRWIYENQPAVLTLRGTSAPVLTSRLAIAGFSTGKVVAIDLARGIPVWEQRVAVPQGRSELDRIVDIDGNLVVTGDTLYVVSYQGRVAGLDIDSGRVLWQREASSYAGLAQGLGSVYVSLVSGTLEAVDERSASALWSNDALARRQLTAPEVFSSYVAFGDFEGYLHLVSQVDGHFVGRKRIDSDGLRARPLVVGDWMYVFGNSGELVALTIR
jgi:outer membrane protein assembly factor BamB